MPFRFGGDAVHVYLTINTGIKAQIAQKEEEIDQLRQTVAGLRRRLEELEDDGRERNQAG